jgi:predicted ABC-class ATPase
MRGSINLMKNPLEFSMLEVDALLRGDAGGPHREFNALLQYVHERQQYLRDYAVQKQAEQIKAKPVTPASTARKTRSMDRELLDAAPVEVVNLPVNLPVSNLMDFPVTSECGPGYSQDRTRAK